MPLQDLRDEPRTSDAPVPDAETCAQMFKAFKATNKDDPKNTLTPDEEKKFEESFKDSKFREILADYMDEISDPAHRAETEAYITQLEGDQQVLAEPFMC
jgi:dynein assembly factor 2